MIIKLIQPILEQYKVTFPKDGQAGDSWLERWTVAFATALSRGELDGVFRALLEEEMTKSNSIEALRHFARSSTFLGTLYFKIEPKFSNSDLDSAIAAVEDFLPEEINFSLIDDSLKKQFDLFAEAYANQKTQVNEKDDKQEPDTNNVNNIDDDVNDHSSFVSNPQTPQEAIINPQDVIARVKLQTQSRESVKEKIASPNRAIFLCETDGILREVGIEKFLRQLNLTFMEEAKQRKSYKPYSLSLNLSDISQKDSLIIDTLKGISTYLEMQAEKSEPDQSFHSLRIAIDFKDQNKELINEFCKMLILLDKMQLKQCTVNTKELEQDDLELIATTLKKMTHAQIRFDQLPLEQDQLPLKQSLNLEEINDQQLQINVPLFAPDETIKSTQNYTANKLNPSIRIRMKAAEEKEVKLAPVQGKVGIQNQHQHQYQQETEQQAELTIMQSWQVEETKQIKHEKKQSKDFYMGEGTLIVWSDINAAMDKKDRQHEAAKLKLGDEILAYRFKDRQLSDLWHRVTGYTGLQQKQIPSYVPKRVSKELLLMMVQYPYYFQDGVFVDALPKDIALDIDGVLSFNSPKGSEISSRRTPPLSADKPIATYFEILLASGIPSANFLSELPELVSEYGRWQMFQRCFSALNRFNAYGIKAINNFAKEALKYSSAEEFFYFSQTIAFYHDQKILFDNSELINKQAEFDSLMQDAYNEGDLNKSPYDISTCPTEWRKEIHAKIIQIMDNKQYGAENNETQRQVLLSLLSSMLKTEALKSIPPLSLSLHKLIEILGTENTFKLIELAASQHINAISNVFLALSNIYQTFKKEGLDYFSQVFLTPSINLFDLAKTEQQLAIKNLLSLTDKEYSWWSGLTLQHAQQSGYGDVAVLMQSFQKFFHEVKSLGFKNLNLQIDLPPCPEGVSNMSVGLSRVFTVLDKVKQPETQFKHHLEGLNWGSYGAAVAVTNDEFQYVTAGMKLGAEERNVFDQFSIKTYGNSLHHKCELVALGIENTKLSKTLKQQAYSSALPLFYRFIGSKQNALSMFEYQDYLRALILPTGYTIYSDYLYSTTDNNGNKVDRITIADDLQPLILSGLLNILANSTAGTRAQDSRRRPLNESGRKNLITSMIQTLYEITSKELFLTAGNPTPCISYKLITEAIYNVINLCDEENVLRLDLSEITQVLQLIKRSLEFCKNGKTYRLDHDQHHGILDKPALQLSHTHSLLKAHGQYFTEALSRFQKFNPQGDYASFLLLSYPLNETNLSPKNKGCLLRLLSLVELSILNVKDDIPSFIVFLKKLQSQSKTEEAMDLFIDTISKIIPIKNNDLSITKINRILEQYLETSLVHLPKNPTDFIKRYLPGYREDFSLKEVDDPEFFKSPSSLNSQYNGLGRLYPSLRQIMLIQYPNFSRYKQQGWDDFLKLIQQLMQPILQDEVVAAIEKSNHPGLCLTSWNNWLKVLLKIDKNRLPVNPKFISELSKGLLETKVEGYITTTDRWFNNPGLSATERDHLAFIKILNVLNELATKKAFNPKSALHAISTFYYLNWTHTVPWDEHYLQFLNTVVTHEKFDGDDLFKAIMSLPSRVEDDPCQTKVIKALLAYLITNIETTSPILIELANDWQQGNKSRLLNLMLVLGHATDNIAIIYNYLKGLDVTNLNQLASCYQTTKPTPPSSLLNNLATNGELANNLDEFIQKHNKDPYHERTEKKLKEQFDNGVLWRYLDRVNFFTNKEETNNYLSQIAKQFGEINELGSKNYQNLPLNEIRDQLKKCRDLIAKNEPGNHVLKAIALIREAIYKSVHLWPSTVQMLALLSRINLLTNKDNDISPFFLQMATGEGKSLYALMEGLLQWVNGFGVAIVTHRASHALRDAQAFKPLLDKLGIESEHLTVNSYQLDKKYAFEGIYYVEFSELALIRQQIILDIGLDLSNMAFVIDEADEIILHNETENNLSQSDSNCSSHPYALAFEGLAAYIDLHAKPSIEQGQPTTHIMSDVLEFLKNNYPTSALAYSQVDFLEKLPDYLNASWLAASLKENEDFIAKRFIDGQYYAAVLINDKAMPVNVTFNGFIQQALHGRLNYENKKKPSTPTYHVAPETTLYSTMSPQALLQWMVAMKTQVIAVSATLGGPTAQEQMQMQYGFRFIKLPKMQSTLRVNYPVQFCVDEKKQFEQILDVCKDHIKKKENKRQYALLITVESIEFAEKLKKYLQDRQFNPETLHAGIDIDDNTMAEVEHRAGKANHILIAMNGLIERGFDIKLSTAIQTIVIATDLSSQSIEDQKKGRTSRMNSKTGVRDEGKFYEIYNLEAENKRYPNHPNPYTERVDTNPELYKSHHYIQHDKRQLQLTLPRQLISISKDAIQNHFNSFWIFIKTSKLPAKHYDAILAIYAEQLNKITAIVPHIVFTEEGRQPLCEQYNKEILELYAEGFERINAISAEKFLFQSDNLAKYINKEQEQLIEDHARLILVKPDANEPLPKISVEWNKHVSYNTYIEPGKQSTLNYFVNGAAKMLFLSSEDKDKIIKSEDNLRNKLTKKAKNKCNFLKSYDLMQKHSTLEVDPILEETTEYFHHEITEKVLGDSIIFIYDPLAGKPGQIILRSSSKTSFQNLQTVVNTMYNEIPSMPDLQFRLSKLAGQNQLVIDFSSHVFDSFNRVELLRSLAEKMKHNISKLFETAHIPPLQTMKMIVKRLHDGQDESNDNRIKYYNSTYKKFIESEKEKSPESPLCKALFSIDKKEQLEYPNTVGELLIAAPSSFNNLNDLDNIYKKRQIISSLLGLIKGCTDRSQQVKSIRSLCKAMATNDNKTAESIYHDFEQQNYAVKQGELSFTQLMKTQKSTGSSFWNKSPDFSTVVDKITSIINENKLSLEPSIGASITPKSQTFL